MLMKFNTLLFLTIGTTLITFFFCEFLVYYVVLTKCSWPNESNMGKLMQAGESTPVRAMLLADTHLLGPFRGHWWDKLRREWQMHRAFQSAVQWFRPEIVFFLGDLFDEGQWVDHRGFRDYLFRFRKLFHVPKDIKTVSLVGNHDVGFHYRMNPTQVKRFNRSFNQSAVSLFSFRDIHFVTINSMAMENDGCDFCQEAVKQMKDMHDIFECSRDKTQCKTEDNIKALKYSRPIVLQHFPTYRQSDKDCLEGDIPSIEPYRENWEVLTRQSTAFIGKALNPRVMFSGHSHHYCKIRNGLAIDEYTIASFSWRNKDNPSFLLAHFTMDSHAVSLCYLPNETTVIRLYMFAAFLNFLYLTFYVFQKRKNKYE